MEEYIKWLENKIEVCLEDKDLQREHWAFCQALKKYRELVLRQPPVMRCIIDYTNWLTKQNLIICEGVDGYTFRSSMIGGKKYTAEELYDKFVSEYVA